MQAHRCLRLLRARRCCITAALLACTALAAQAATTHGATVSVSASASNAAGPAASASDFDGKVNSAAGVSFSASTGLLSGQRAFTQAYDGRCVVIATGNPCQGGEAPLTTQTILDGNKPITAPVGTSASARASAYARGGSVGASALSANSTAIGHVGIDPVNPTLTVPGVRQTTGSSQAQASASLAHTNTLMGQAGATATITIRGSAHSFLSVSDAAQLGNTAFALLSVTGRSAAPGQNCSLVSAGCFGEFALSRYANPDSLTPVEEGDVTRNFSFSFESRTGDVVSLLAYASAATTNTGEADASHTLRIDQIELSDGFQFADEAGLVRIGNVYAFAAAVPEPQSWAMVAVGLLVVGTVARRRGRRMRAA